MTRLQFDPGGKPPIKNANAGSQKRTDLIFACRRNQMQSQAIGIGLLARAEDSRSVMVRQELVAAAVVARKSREDHLSQVAKNGEFSDTIEDTYHVEDALEVSFVSIEGSAAE